MYQRVVVLAILAGSCAIVTAGESAASSDSLLSSLSFAGLLRQVPFPEFLRRVRMDGGNCTCSKWCGLGIDPLAIARRGSLFLSSRSGVVWRRKLTSNNTK